MSLYLIRQNSDLSSDLDGLGNYEELQLLSDLGLYRLCSATLEQLFKI